MCTYVTEQRDMTGSAKAATGWMPVRVATVYYDHPVHAQADHTLNLDFADPSRGPSARAAVELTADSAVRLMEAVAAVLAAVPEDLSGVDPALMATVRDTISAAVVD